MQSCAKYVYMSNFILTLSVQVMSSFSSLELLSAIQILFCLASTSNSKMLSSAIFSCILVAAAKSQQVGSYVPEEHPKISWKNCSADICSTVNGSVVLDANYRWLHDVDGYKSCYDGNEWTDLCSSSDNCAVKCALDGAEYRVVVRFCLFPISQILEERECVCY